MTIKSRIDIDDETYMPEARYIVEEHIRIYGKMVPYPDRLKEAISKALGRVSRGVSPI